MDDSQNAGWNKPFTEGHRLCGSICTTFLKRLKLQWQKPDQRGE